MSLHLVLFGRHEKNTYGNTFVLNSWLDENEKRQEHTSINVPVAITTVKLEYNAMAAI